MMYGYIPSKMSAARLARAEQFSASLPTPPLGYNYQAAVKGPWLMLGNDVNPNCVQAGFGHLLMTWSALTGHPCSVTDKAAVDWYNKYYWNQDGSSPDDVLGHWASDGFGGVTVYGYAPVAQGADRQFYTLSWLFGGSLCGAFLPSSNAWENVDGRHVWNQPAGIAGGHAYPVLADSGDGRGLEYVTSWGDPMYGQTPLFRRSRSVMECWVVLTSAHFNSKGLTWHGFTPAQMGQWLLSVGGTIVNPLPQGPVTPPPAPTIDPSSGRVLGQGAPLSFGNAGEAGVGINLLNPDNTVAASAFMPLHVPRPGAYKTVVYLKSP